MCSSNVRLFSKQFQLSQVVGGGAGGGQKVFSKPSSVSFALSVSLIFLINLIFVINCINLIILINFMLFEI
jgi:hypothetical protein